MPQFTVFWSHPRMGKGAYITSYATARDAAEEACDNLPCEHASMGDDGHDALSEMEIRNSLSIKVWSGDHTEEPTRKPDYEIM